MSTGILGSAEIRWRAGMEQISLRHWSALAHAVAFVQGLEGLAQALARGGDLRPDPGGLGRVRYADGDYLAVSYRLLDLSALEVRARQALAGLSVVTVQSRSVNRWDRFPVASGRPWPWSRLCGGTPRC